MTVNDNQNPYGLCKSTPVIVKIGGTRIPTQRVETYISKDGVSDVNRLTKVYFPAEWNNTSVIDKIAAFDPNSQSAYDRATIMYRDRASQSLVPVQRGYVRGVGSASKTGLMKLWVSDPSSLTSAISFSGSYVDVPISEFLGDIQEKIQQNTIFNGMKISSDGGVIHKEESYGDPISVLKSIDFSGTLGQGTQKTFRANKDTIKDAMEWLTSIEGGVWYFDFDGSNLVLVYNPTINQQSFSGTENGGSLNIIENDAIEEIMPINMLTVNGSTGVAIGGHELAFFPGKKFPQVTVTYTPLVERTGTRASGPIVNSKAVTLDSAESIAKHKLKEEIQTHGEGDILMHGAPLLSLFDKITARPICNSQLEVGNTAPVEYEVQGVTHECIEGVFKTRANVSTFVNYNEISVTESRMATQ